MFFLPHLVAKLVCSTFSAHRHILCCTVQKHKQKRNILMCRLFKFTFVFELVFVFVLILIFLYFFCKKLTVFSSGNHWRGTPSLRPVYVQPGDTLIRSNKDVIPLHATSITLYNMNVKNYIVLHIDSEKITHTIKKIFRPTMRSHSTWPTGSPLSLALCSTLSSYPGTQY